MRGEGRGEEGRGEEGKEGREGGRCVCVCVCLQVQCL